MDPCEARDSAEVLFLAARAHDGLRVCADRTEADNITAVLNLGAAVRLHRLLEEAVVVRANPYLAAGVVQELRQDHEQLAADLECLAELAASVSGAEAPASEREREDAGAMSRAVLERLRRHLDRDDRVLYRPLARLREGETADGRA